MLHIDSFALIAGEGDIQIGEEAVADHPREILTVVEILTRVTVPEEEPVAAAVPEGAPMLKKPWNGEIPVPAPIITIGTEGSSGGWKCGDRCRNIDARAARSAMNVEHTPPRSTPSTPRYRTIDTNSRTSSGLINGDDEME